MVTDFQVHGSYCISNACGFEIELSSDGGRARTRDAGTYTDTPEISEWLTIEEVPNEDFDGDENDDDAYHSVIDPNGICIPLSLVMRAN